MEFFALPYERQSSAIILSGLEQVSSSKVAPVMHNSINVFSWSLPYGNMRCLVSDAIQHGVKLVIYVTRSQVVTVVFT